MIGSWSPLSLPPRRLTTVSIPGRLTCALRVTTASQNRHTRVELTRQTLRASGAIGSRMKRACTAYASAAAPCTD